MTDYNDGEWHIWNGGERPVHSRTRVKIQMANETRLMTDGNSDRAAGDLDWRGRSALPTSAICAFRVVKAHREPRTFWAVGQTLHDTKEEAEEFLVRCRASNPNITFGADHEPRKLIEVLE